MTVTPVVCSARARRTVSPRPCAPLTPGMPRRWLAAKGGYGATQGTFLLPPKGGPVSQANLCPRLSRRGLEHSHCGAGSRTRRADALQRPSSEQRCIWHGQAVRVQVMAYIRTAPSPHPSASDPAIRTSRLPGRISHPRRSTPQKPPSVSLPSRQE